MKFQQIILVGLVLISSYMAKAALVAKGCYQDVDKKMGPFVVQVEIHDDAVLINYIGKNKLSLGSYRGKIYQKSEIKKNAMGAVVSNVTLTDGQDGQIDGAYIEITKTTVTFDSKSNKYGPQAQVVCPKN
jgi:hypothetical protein